jgi:stress response protein YsnF
MMLVFGAQGEQAAGGQAAAAGDTNIMIPLYKEQLQVQTRKVPAGEVHLRKEVKTETVTQPVQIRRETVTIERQEGAAQTLTPTGRDQAAPGAAPGAEEGQAEQTKTFQEQDITVQLFREEPLVTKQLVPAGQIVLQKKIETQQQNVQEQVRREEIQISKSGEAQNVNISQNLQGAVVEHQQGQEAMGAPPEGQETTSGEGSSRAITDLETLTSTSDPSSLVNRPVQLSEAEVQSTINNRWFSIRGEGGDQVFVHSSQPFQNLKEGSQAQITGTLKQLPSDLSQFGLDEQAAQKLQGQKFYLEATQVSPANQ